MKCGDCEHWRKRKVIDDVVGRGDCHYNSIESLGVTEYKTECLLIEILTKHGRPDE